MNTQATQLNKATGNAMMQAFMNARETSESARVLIDRAVTLRAIEDKKQLDKIACKYNQLAKQWDKEHAKQEQFNRARDLAMKQLQAQEHAAAIARCEQEANKVKLAEYRAKLLASKTIKAPAQPAQPAQAHGKVSQVHVHVAQNKSYTRIVHE